MFGQKIGTLSEDRYTQLSFQYEPGVKQALSVRLPVREEEYSHIYAYPFFENLTPEGRPLEIIANKFRISENNPFSILEKIGGDCAGAVALYDGERPARSNEQLREISKKEMAQIIDELPENPLLTGIKDTPRLSLAGAQSKFALCAGAEETFFSPNDEYPSTQLIKVENNIYKNILHNELFCMNLAHEVGLPVSAACLREAEGRLFLDISRYDRFIVSRQNGIFKALRIHQEDFCQALGYPSIKKYQSDGGPGLRVCYQAIDKYSNNKIADLFSFLLWIVFNYIIGNADAHAKNISFLHKDGKITLAPFYDLLSTEVYPQKISSRKIAMLINGKYQYDKIKYEDFIELCKQLGINPLQTMKNVSKYFDHITDKARSLKDRLNADPLTASSVYDDIITLIVQRTLKNTMLTG